MVYHTISRVSLGALAEACQDELAAAEKPLTGCDPAIHSITLSARSMVTLERVTPIAFAVFMFTTS